MSKNEKSLAVRCGQLRSNSGRPEPELYYRRFPKSRLGEESIARKSA